MTMQSTQYIFRWSMSSVHVNFLYKLLTHGVKLLVGPAPSYDAGRVPKWIRCFRSTVTAVESVGEFVIGMPLIKTVSLYVFWVADYESRGLESLKWFKNCSFRFFCDILIMNCK